MISISPDVVRCALVNELQLRVFLYNYLYYMFWYNHQLLLYHQLLKLISNVQIRDVYMFYSKMYESDWGNVLMADFSVFLFTYWFRRRLNVTRKTKCVCHAAFFSMYIYIEYIVQIFRFPFIFSSVEVSLHCTKWKRRRKKPDLQFDSPAERQFCTYKTVCGKYIQTK